MKCVLHVGIHKTGSTAIQKAMSGYDDGSTVYADLEHRNHTIPLQIIFASHIARPYQKRMGLSDDAMRAEAARLTAKLDKSLNADRKQIILSAEGASVFPVPKLKAMRDHLMKSVESIEILMFVRDPLNWQASVYQEVLKHGTTDPYTPGHGDIRGRYKRLAEVFGKENIRVLRYEDKSRYDGDIVDYFCDLTGVDKERVNSDKEQVNSSLSEQAIKILYRQLTLNPVLTGGEASFRSYQYFFIRLAEIFKDDGKFDRTMFGAMVDQEDYVFLRDELGIDYDLSFSTENDIFTYLKNIDPDAIAKVGSFLRGRGFDYDYASDPDMAISTLFQFCVAQAFGELGDVPNAKYDKRLDRLLAEWSRSRNSPWIKIRNLFKRSS